MTLQEQMKARADFYAARMDYAKALGRGDATREQHQNLLALQATYEATA